MPNKIRILSKELENLYYIVKWDSYYHEDIVAEAKIRIPIVEEKIKEEKVKRIKEIA